MMDKNLVNITYYVVLVMIVLLSKSTRTKDTFLRVNALANVMQPFNLTSGRN